MTMPRPYHYLYHSAPIAIVRPNSGRTGDLGNAADDRTLRARFAERKAELRRVRSRGAGGTFTTALTFPLAMLKAVLTSAVNTAMAQRHRYRQPTMNYAAHWWHSYTGWPAMRSARQAVASTWTQSAA
jgi:hypothetical protein